VREGLLGVKRRLESHYKLTAGESPVGRKAKMEKLKPCPFCGGESDILVTKDSFKIVGCKTKSMLCPNPTLVV
jgi:hypothetical protein